MGLYEYIKEPVDREAYKLSQENTPGIYRLSFSSPFKTGIAGNDTVHAGMFQEGGKPGGPPLKSKELMILVHGFATRAARLENYHTFASSMAGKGITTLFLHLPLHLERLPSGEASGRRLISFDDRQTLDFFHQAVVDTRKLVDVGRALLEPERIYLCGISMGSMVSALVIAFEDRIDRAALIMGGGNWEEIHWKGILRYMLKGDCSRGSTDKKRAECRKAYRVFPDFLQEFKRTGKHGLDAGFEGTGKLKDVTPRACFLCDPMAFGHMVDPGRILMINSRFDMYFSRRSALYLWKEMGRPRIIWLNSLHSSKILRNKKIQEAVSGFFRK